MQSSKKLRFAVLVVIVAAYVPLLWLHVCRLWSSDQYRYFPLVLVAVALLCWTRLRPELAMSDSMPRGGKVWLLAALVSLVAAVLLWSPWLAAWSFVVFLWYALRFLAGRRGRAVAPIWALPILLIPLPLKWGESLVDWVQDASAQWSSVLLDSLAVDHLLADLTLSVPGREFSVSEVGSGIPSLFSLIALAAVLAAWLRRPLIHALLLVVAGGFWAAIIGTLRLLGVVLLHAWYAVDAASGLEWLTLQSGLVAFAAWMLLCSDRFILFFLAPIDGGLEREESSAAVATCQLVPVAATSRFVLVVAACFALLGAAQIICLVRVPGPSMGSHHHLQQQQLAASLTATTMPNRILNCEQASFELSDDTVHSARWTYRGAGGPISLTLNFPVDGWQAVTNGLEGTGWNVESREVVRLSKTGASSVPALVRIRLADDRGNRALLLASQLERDGKLLPPPEEMETRPSSWLLSLQQRLSGRLADFGYQRSTYQVRMILDAPASHADRRISEAQSLEAFLQARQRIAECLTHVASEHHG